MSNHKPPNGQQTPKGEKEYHHSSPSTAHDPAPAPVTHAPAPVPAHVPVLLTEVLGTLSPSPGAVAVDATLGMAGHSLALLQELTPGGFLLGIDRDPSMARRALARLARESPEGSQWEVRPGNAADLSKHLKGTAAENGFDLFLMDCGLASPHYDEAERGFSFRHEGPLRMKLNPTAPGPDAEELVNEADPQFLTRLIRIFGEEAQAGRIVRRLVDERSSRRIATTRKLAEIVVEAYPQRFRRGKRHPATKTFQALRIWINDELGSLATAIQQAVTGLKIGGRAAFIGFHSHENRLIKKTLQAASLSESGETPSLKISKGIKPTEEEMKINPRSRSALLRFCTKNSPLPKDIQWPQPPAIKLP